jgi:aminopeptidase
MTDPRVTKLAQILIHYSLAVKPGQQIFIQTYPLANELTLAVYEEAINAGANAVLWNIVPEADEIFFHQASDAQLEYVSPISRLVTETFDGYLHLKATHNTRALSGIDNTRIAHAMRAFSPIQKIFNQRAARKELNWCLTIYPTEAMAQEADMSLRAFQEFVYTAGMLHLDNPVTYWQGEGLRQRKIIERLVGKDRVILKGSNVDLRFSIKDRTFEPCDGKANFPDGEIFTGPVEDSANGWIRFRYPAIRSSQEVTDIELWFENGQVVQEKAEKNQELLTSSLNTDAGARYLGEFGIGTNYGIQRFTKNMLFDEKMGGTIHLALGMGYPETGSKNESSIHWDMLCDMTDGEITVDGEMLYKNGQFVD